jgi:hypothetical protein
MYENTENNYCDAGAGLSGCGNSFLSVIGSSSIPYWKLNFILLSLRMDLKNALPKLHWN